ncbi:MULTISPECIES: hypothetical protein [unclassified Methanosarcina]|nr:MULTISPECIES: hypothetical protein [unclassified Methanosarcina]
MFPYSLLLIFDSVVPFMLSFCPEGGYKFLVIEIGPIVPDKNNLLI